MAATPTVVYVRVQAASGETTVAANETVEDVRLDSEAGRRAGWTDLDGKEMWV